MNNFFILNSTILILRISNKILAIRGVFIPVKTIDTITFTSLTKFCQFLMLDLIVDDFIDPYFEYKIYAINCVKVQECIYCYLMT